MLSKDSLSSNINISNINDINLDNFANVNVKDVSNKSNNGKNHSDMPYMNMKDDLLLTPNSYSNSNTVISDNNMSENSPVSKINFESDIPVLDK